MHYRFTYRLTNEERNQILVFLEQFEGIGIEQHPDYLPIIYGNKKICYVTCFHHNDIIAYSAVIEKNKAAFIYFGPLMTDCSNGSDLFTELYKYYSKLSFAFIKIYPVLNFNKNTAFNTFLNNKTITLNDKWATISIDITGDLNSIKNKFSVHHKRQLNKSYREHLLVKELENPSQVENLAEIYNQMYKNRKIITYLYDVSEVFINLFHWIRKDNGFILGVYKDEVMIGGLIILYAGNTAFFQFGASEKKYHHLPVLHAAFYKAFEMSKSAGKANFDMGGYSIDVDVNDQLYSINRFKRGFGGKIVEYPHNINIRINNTSYLLYFLKKRIFTLYRKIF